MTHADVEAVADILLAARENAVLSLSILATLADAGSPALLPRLVELCNNQAQHLQALSHTASALLIQEGKNVRLDPTDD